MDAVAAGLRADLGHHRIQLPGLDVGDVHVGRLLQPGQLVAQQRRAQMPAEVRQFELVVAEGGEVAAQDLGAVPGFETNPG